MSAARSVGRVRGLAAALGIGAAVLTGCGIAAADPGSPEPAPAGDTAAGDAAVSGSAGPTRGLTVGTRHSKLPRTPSAAASAGPGPTSPDDISRAAGTPKKGDRATAARPGRSPSASPPLSPASVPPAGSAPAVADSGSGAAEVAGPSATIEAAGTAITPSASPVAPPPAAASALPAAASPMPSSVLVAQQSPPVPPIDLATTVTVMAVSLTALIHIGVAISVAALTPAPQSPSTVTPTLNVGGLDFVPSSTREITSLYGRWTYLPGAPGMVQGQQQFDVVDPKTVETVGTFGALVSRGTGIDYTALLVTSNDGTNVGADAGQVPPVGSLITRLQLGLIGLAYSAIPSPAGDVVSFAITTPFGDIPLALTFDAAAGIADRTVDNRPIELGDGFTMAPAGPDSETLTAISGILPLFSTVQGYQVFNIYDADGNSVGSFDGVFTTTADVIGTYTQAVMVTANDGVNVGTAAGQVPPVGSVYNVIYEGADDHYLLYASKPTQSGNEVSVIGGNKGVVTRSGLTLIDASAPPTETLSGAGGFRFVPVSALQPSGVNGLPPRDVQIQGYRQFDVYDASGTRVGAVDADVSNQWDWLGIHSATVLVTKVTEGDAGEVPPAGSVFNFVSSGDSGFGSAHSVMPLESGDLTSFKFVTPWGDIPMPSSLTPATDRALVSYFSPFTTV